MIHRQTEFCSYKTASFPTSREPKWSLPYHPLSVIKSQTALIIGWTNFVSKCEDKAICPLTPLTSFHITFQSIQLNHELPMNCAPDREPRTKTQKEPPSPHLCLGQHQSPGKMNSSSQILILEPRASPSVTSSFKI